MKTIEKLTITRVAIKDIETKYGVKPKVGILTNEFGEKWLGHFAKGKYDRAMNLREGDVIQAVVDVGEKFVNFSMDKMDILEARVEALENFMKGSKINTNPATGELAKDEIDADELGF